MFGQMANLGRRMPFGFDPEANAMPQAAPMATGAGSPIADPGSIAPQMSMMPAQPTPQIKKPGFFGNLINGGEQGGGGEFIRNFLMYALAGKNAPFLAQMQMHRQDQDRQLQLAQLQRQQDLQDFRIKRQIERDNPAPTELDRAITAAGIDPKSEQGVALYRRFAENKANPMQWLSGIGADGRPTMTGVRPPLPKAPPAVGAIEKGHRFKGGDPASPSSWEPVAAAGETEAPSIIQRATAAGKITRAEADRLREALGPNGQAAMAGWMQQNRIQLTD